jgi:hypothetical protein
MFQNLPWLKFSHDSYLCSEFKAKANAQVKAAYLDLLCFAMKQQPALSLPNDDNILATWASVSIELWQQIKDLVLSQFSVNRQDNRYYSNMLLELYQPSNNDSPMQATNVKKQAMTNAERVAKYRAKQKLLAQQAVTASNETSNENSQPVTSRNAVIIDKKEDLENKQEDIKIVTPKVTVKNVTSLQSNTPKHMPLATPLWDVLAFKKQQHDQAAQLLTERTIGEQALAQIKKTLGIRQQQTMVMAV